MIVVEELVKRYRSGAGSPALAGVGFTAPRGEIVGFLGENGAGKTTTLRILAGLLAPTAGRVLVGGKDVATDALAVRRFVGWLPEGAPLPGDVRAGEYLRWRAALKEVPRAGRAAAVERALGEAGAGALRGRRIGELSRGERQRVALADALVARPPVLLLDEPGAGLDPNQLREQRAALAALAGEHTIVISSHHLAEIEAIAHRVIILAKGRVAAAGTPAELRAPEERSLDEVFARVTR